MKLTAIVLTLNEEENISDCLAALSWADELLVVDSGSTDKTVEIAQKCGARVIRHPFTDFASQRNFALRQATGDWVLFIDADERVSAELKMEIQQAISVDSSEANLFVYEIPFHTYFLGKRMRFGDAMRDFHARLFPGLSAFWENPVHEQIATALPRKRLKNAVAHLTTKNWAHYKMKIERYVPNELRNMKSQNMRPSLLKAVFMPFFRFMQLYLFKLGILDGITGFQYAILSAYYTGLKHWRYLQFSNRIK